MKRVRLLPLVAALMLTACFPAGTDNEPIKIGLITPLTGEVASLGNDILNGAQLMAEEINAAGGIDGSLIQIVAEDGRCNGTDAVSAIQKLINIDKVVAVHGAGCSSETMAAAPIAEEAGIILMSPSSSNPDISDSGDFIFRTYPNDALKTTAMVKYFSEQDYEKVAMITENTDFCEGFRSALKSKGEEGMFVFDEVVEPGTKDYRSLITRLKDVEFDLFVANVQTPPTGVAMIQQLREQGMEQQVISHDIMDGTVVLELAGEAAEGFQVINVPTIADDSEFGTKFIANNGQPQANMAWAAYGYDTLGVLAEAIAEVGTEGAAMRDYLYDLDEYNAIVGDISFDENGDVLGVKFALREVKDGAFVKIADIAVE